MKKFILLDETEVLMRRDSSITCVLNFTAIYHHCSHLSFIADRKQLIAQNSANISAF